MGEIGQKRWAIAEGYIPGQSHGPAPAMTSHEAICLLNVSDEDAHLSLFLPVRIYYSALIRFFGVEFTKVYARRHGSPIKPEARARRFGHEPG